MLMFLEFPTQEKSSCSMVIGKFVGEHGERKGQDTQMYFC